MEGKAKVVAEIEGEAKLQVSFFPGRWGNYHVIDTDYETYALVYGCSVRDGEPKNENAWVLTRAAIETEDKRLDETDFIKKFEA